MTESSLPQNFVVDRDQIFFLESQCNETITHFVLEGRCLCYPTHSPLHIAARSIGLSPITTAQSNGKIGFAINFENVAQIIPASLDVPEFEVFVQQGDALDEKYNVKSIRELDDPVQTILTFHKIAPLEKPLMLMLPLLKSSLLLAKQKQERLLREAERNDASLRQRPADIKRRPN